MDIVSITLLILIFVAFAAFIGSRVRKSRIKKKGSGSGGGSIKPNPPRDNQIK